MYILQDTNAVITSPHILHILQHTSQITIQHPNIYHKRHTCIYTQSSYYTVYNTQVRLRYSIAIYIVVGITSPHITNFITHSQDYNIYILQDTDAVISSHHITHFTFHS